jgi:hypothetical protein
VSRGKTRQNLGAGLLRLSLLRFKSYCGFREKKNIEKPCRVNGAGYTNGAARTANTHNRGYHGLLYLSD